MKTISFILPVFRNKGSIHLTCQKIISLIEQEHSDLSYEIVLVNDGSDDGSWDEIVQLTNHNHKIKGISFSKNYGQVPAIVAGLRNCKGDLAIVMSADLQDPVEMIHKMLHSWGNGYEVIICYRTSREDRWIDRFFSAAFYRSIRLIYPEIPLGGFDFFGMDRGAVDEFNCIEKGGRFLQGDVIQLNASKSFLPYERLARKNGKSQWTFSRKVKYAFYAYFSSPIGVLFLLSLFVVIASSCIWMFLGLQWAYIFCTCFLVLYGSIILVLPKKKQNVCNLSKVSFSIDEKFNKVR